MFISANTNQHTFLEKRDAFKTRFFFPAGKRTVFGIQRKRGSLAGQVVPNRFSAARLYAPVVVRPRPRWTTWAEQGQAVVLSPLFSPPARVGVGAWRRRLVFPLSRDGVPSLLPIHSSLFPLPFLCGARRLGAPLGSLSEGAVAKWRLRESKTFPPLGGEGGWPKARRMRGRWIEQKAKFTAPAHPHPPQCTHWGTFPLGGGRFYKARNQGPRESA